MYKRFIFNLFWRISKLFLRQLHNLLLTKEFAIHLYIDLEMRMRMEFFEQLVKEWQL